MDFDELKNKLIKENDPEIKKVEDEMFKLLISDQEIMEYLKKLNIFDYNLIRKNISTFYAIKEDLDYCKHCPGLYKCAKEHPNYIFSLKQYQTIIDKVLIPCELKIKDEKINESYVIRDFPLPWRDSTITKLDKSRVRMPLFKRYKDALNSNHNWLFITGSHRSGKSFIAATLLNDLINSYKGRGAFLNYPDRVRELQDYTYNNKDNFIKLMRLYTSVDYLVLDDFGNEFKSEYIRDSITIAILNERARKGLITIFTSEFNFEDIANMYMLNNAGKARSKQLHNLLVNYSISEIDISTANIY